MLRGLIVFAAYKCNYITTKVQSAIEITSSSSSSRKKRTHARTLSTLILLAIGEIEKRIANKS